MVIVISSLTQSFIQIGPHAFSSNRVAALDVFPTDKKDYHRYRVTSLALLVALQPRFDIVSTILKKQVLVVHIIRWHHMLWHSELHTDKPSACSTHYKMASHTLTQWVCTILINQVLVVHIIRWHRTLWHSEHHTDKPSACSTHYKMASHALTQWAPYW